MILVDTSVWIDHFRASDPLLAELLEARELMMHPYILGEISLGQLRDRRETLLTLADLPRSVVADEMEVSHLIETERLFGAGIGYVDAQILASTMLTRDAKLWTRDRRLRSVSERLRVAARIVH